LAWVVVGLVLAAGLMVGAVAGQMIEDLRAELAACRAEVARLQSHATGRPDYLAVPTVAERLGVSPSRVYQLIRRGRLGEVETRPHPGGKAYLIPVAAIERYESERGRREEAAELRRWLNQ
jgi:excisionase family DNA binding protein